MGKTISISTFDEFKALFRVDHKNSIVAESPSIAPNSYAYSNTLNALHVNDQSTIESFSVFTEEIGIVDVGDVIEITSEIMNISGEKVKIGIDAYTIDGSQAGGKIEQIAELQSEKSGEFENLGGKFIIDQLCYVKIFIGIWAADVGEYYVRNINIISTSNHYSGKPKKISKHCVIHKAGGSGIWEIRDAFYHDAGSVEVLDNQTLLFTFYEKFNIRPVVILGGEYYNGAYKHRPVSSYADENGFRIRFINSSGIEDILDNIIEGYHINIMATGI